MAMGHVRTVRLQGVALQVIGIHVGMVQGRLLAFRIFPPPGFLLLRGLDCRLLPSRRPTGLASFLRVLGHRDDPLRLNVGSATEAWNRSAENWFRGSWTASHNPGRGQHSSTPLDTSILRWTVIGIFRTAPS